MGRKKQNPEESVKRLQILQTATRLFMQQGYKALSMDVLCEAVPVSKRTLYNHFSDKKALFSAVMQACCQHLFESLQASLSEGEEPERNLTEFAATFLDLVLDPQAIGIYRIAMMEAPQFPELGVLFYDCGPKRSMSVLAVYLKKLHEKKILNVPDPEMSAHFFLYMLKSRPQTQCLVGLKDSISTQEKRAIAKHAVHCFLHGHLPR